MSDKMQWARSAEGRFAVKQWDDGAVVYDIIAGDTHVVEPLVMELLRLLELRSPRTIAELTAELVPLLPEESEVAISDATSGAISRLSEIGLVVGDGG